jgi:hypothetical protein
MSRGLRRILIAVVAIFLATILAVCVLNAPA